MSNSATTDILIIGAGLTGLTLARNLEQQGRQYLVLEARDRIGGRIHTHKTENGPKVELGATWFFPNFKTLYKLLKNINVQLKEQFMKGNTLHENGETQKPRKIYSSASNDMFRISGGTSNIIKTIHDNLTNKNNVLLSQQVKRISMKGSGMEVETTAGSVFKCNKVVTTIPPQLLYYSVQFEPKLPENLSQIMRKTHTWMGDSVKGVVTYDNAWWKDQGFSGGLYSNNGPVVQMYDQSDENGAALVGFLEDSSADKSQEQRKKAVIQQLIRVFGEKAANYKEYRDTAWKHEPFTMPPVVPRLSRHSNVGHRIYQESYMEGRLYIGGTESSSYAGGFMEGAVFSANTIADKLSK